MMNEKMNAIEIALKMETDAISFYQEAAELTSHPAGKRMFLSIMEDEKRHIDMLNNLVNDMELTADKIDPMEKIKSVFEELKDEMMGGIEASENELQALETAMKMEKEGFEFYKKVAAESPDPKSKKLFERLVLEEEKHYAAFSNTYAFLSDTGNWFMWEEHSIVDGGTPTA
jgi:rubrerythrin